MLNNTTRKSRYMPGLDGLRAISVLAVIAYHLNLNWAPGGFLGVGVFFVLSGYLITDQLVAKWQRDRSLDLKNFWLRRARRLLPAMLLMTAVVCAWLALTDPSRLGTLGGDVLSAVTYVNNWWLIFHKVSYFESFGPPSPFGHYWSLAVEEQFYLLWPLLLAIGMRFVPQRGKLTGLILAGAAVSALLMALLYVPGTDPSRVYYGSDTRVFGLLIGAALAVVWPSAKLSESVSRGARAALNIGGAGALAALLCMIWKTQEYDAFVYRGGLVLLSVVSAILVASLAHPASGVARILAAKPLRWLGVRTYGIYLWHFPVIALTSPAVDTEGVNVWRAVLQVAASIALASLSWKYVEQPILSGSWRKKTAEFRASWGRSTFARRPITALVTAGLTLVLCVSCVGTGQAGDERGAHASGAASGIEASAGPDGGSLATDGTGSSAGDGGSSGANSGDAALETAGLGSSGKGDAAGQPATPNQAGGGTQVKLPPTGNGSGGAPAQKPGTNGAKPKPSEAGAGGAVASPGTSASNEAGAEGTKAPSSGDQPGKGITVIGDSVILGVQSSLEKLLPGIVVDGKVGRQLTQAFDTIDEHKKAGDLGGIVVLELGTNGPFTEKKLGQLLDSLGDERQILLVNTRVPRKWQNDVNKLLASAADDRDNVTLVDWYAESKGKDAYFAKDGVHLNRSGAEDYAEMLEKAIGALKQV